MLNGVLEKNDLYVIHIHAGAPYPVREHHCQQDDCRVLEARMNGPVLVTSWNLLKSNTKARSAKAENSNDMEPNTQIIRKANQKWKKKKKKTFIKVIAESNYSSSPNCNIA